MFSGLDLQLSTFQNSLGFKTATMNIDVCIGGLFYCFTDTIILPVNVHYFYKRSDVVCIAVS